VRCRARLRAPGAGGGALSHDRQSGKMRLPRAFAVRFHWTSSVQRTRHPPTITHTQHSAVKTGPRGAVLRCEPTVERPRHGSLGSLASSFPGETLSLQRCVTLQRLRSPACVRGTNLPLSPLPFEHCLGFLEATSGRCRGRGHLIQSLDLRFQCAVD
jgi:hypothetical protein